MTIRHAEILRAQGAAKRARAELGLDSDSPVDVFAAIRRAGLWLLFNETEHLLGAMSREGVGGIMINPARPVGLQRYTAAHELGHWYLHPDEVVWDSEDETNRSDPIKELGAQEFAASFLMPRRLVNHTLRKFGVELGGRIDDATAYRLGLSLGVSYEAILRQLQKINAITFAERAELARSSPASIKASLTGGRSVNRDAAVWQTSVDEMERLEVVLGDEIAISLPENRTTGYRWRVSDTHVPLNLVQDNFVRSDDRLIGASGRRDLFFRAESEGDWQQLLLLQRKTREPSPPAQQLSLNAKVRLSPARENAKIIARPNDRDD
jgi:Zn-dependent peptidase ImmA (M78 family)